MEMYFLLDTDAGEISDECCDITKEPTSVPLERKKKKKLRGS